MASTAITAQGTALTIDSTAIKNVISFTGLDGQANEIEVTNLQSVAKEFLVGLADNGNFSFEWHPDYSDPGQNDVRAAAISGATVAMELTLSDATTVAFNALVQNADTITGGVDAALGGSVSMRVTGAVTITTSP